MVSHAEAALARRSNGPVHVFVVESHELAMQGLRELLEGEGFEVAGGCWSALEASNRIVDGGADVVVLDGRVPDGTGIEVCRIVRSVDVNVQCIMLTSYADDEAVRGVVLAGAAGYVLRQVRGHDLIEAIRRVLAGYWLLDLRAVNRARRGLAEAATDANFGGLTGAEREVLALISYGLTNRQISEALGMAEIAVRALVGTLLFKLGFGPRSGPASAQRRDTRVPRIDDGY